MFVSIFDAINDLQLFVVLIVFVAFTIELRHKLSSTKLSLSKIISPFNNKPLSNFKLL